MNWKEFFRPTNEKVLFFAVYFSIFFLMYLYLNSYGCGSSSGGAPYGCGFRSWTQILDTQNYFNSWASMILNSIVIFNVIELGKPIFVIILSQFFACQSTQFLKPKKPHKSKPKQ